MQAIPHCSFMTTEYIAMNYEFPNISSYSASSWRLLNRFPCTSCLYIRCPFTQLSTRICPDTIWLELGYDGRFMNICFKHQAPTTEQSCQNCTLLPYWIQPSIRHWQAHHELHPLIYHLPPAAWQYSDSFARPTEPFMTNPQWHSNISRHVSMCHPAPQAIQKTLPKRPMPSYIRDMPRRPPDKCWTYRIGLVMIWGNVLPDSRGKRAC